MELPHALIADILEKLPVKSLLRFKSVSTKWKSMIESPYFKKKQLLYSQLQDPDILLINPYEREGNENVTRMFTTGSSDLIKLPNVCPLHYNCGYFVCGSCDGMICFYNHFTCIYLVNPITGWFRSVPKAKHQEVVARRVMSQRIWEYEDISFGNLGFGKDKFTGRYKLVWLYNSRELSLSNATVCEVFDFNTNIWRYVTASPVRIRFDKQAPVHLDGSLYWFTDEIKILSLDIHTEKFHIIAETPFVEVDSSYNMCTLNNRLCVSQKVWPKQEIWSLNNSDMTWEKIYSLDRQTNYHSFTNSYTLIPETVSCAKPIAVLKNKKKSLVIYFEKHPVLVRYDPESRTYDLCFVPHYRGHIRGNAFSCFPSLMSIE